LSRAAFLDAIGSVLGREALLVPLAAEPGVVAAVNTPDGRQGQRALDPHGDYPEWQQEIAARSAIAVGSYRPLRAASRIESPLLVVACEDDETVLAGPGIRAAERAPRGEVARLPGGHYSPFLGCYERAVEAELEFLRLHLLATPRTPHAQPRGDQAAETQVT